MIVLYKVNDELHNATIRLLKKQESLKLTHYALFITLDLKLHASLIDSWSMFVYLFSM